MGDLHCPARVLLLAVSLSPAPGGRWKDDDAGPARVARMLAEALVSHRVAAVYVTPAGWAAPSAARSAGNSQELARRLADRLSVPAHVLDGLLTLGPVAPGQRAEHALGEVADTHRGECVLLVQAGDWTGLEHLARTLGVALGPDPASGEAGTWLAVVAALEHDSDGWRRTGAWTVPADAASEQP